MVCSLQHKWRVEDVRVNNLVAVCREGGRQGGEGEEEGGGGGQGGEEEEKQRKQEGEKRE